MSSSSNKTLQQLEAEIGDLILKNEALNRQLIKTWRDMVRLADTTIRLETENTQLKQYKGEEFGRHIQS
jgi:hypothetical protein